MRFSDGNGDRRLGFFSEGRLADQSDTTIAKSFSFIHLTRLASSSGFAAASVNCRT